MREKPSEWKIHKIKFKNIVSVGRIDFDDLNFERSKYSAFGAYSQSKLANILFAKELARQLEENGIDGVSTYSVHPGVVSTELGRHLNKTYFTGLSKAIRLLMGRFFKTAEEGAQTIVYCALSVEAGKETGLYYYNCETVKPAGAAENMEDAKKLWEESIKLVKLENYNPFTSC
ncbi:retinol dehydrogenase 13-like [Photinus pyralis]|uniref:retinol dehydrogenase 13-like n=1 Tax=Photinus pyralis TaxID=7054 RepID=UPI001266F0C2|nr:retinol dehydrogenase 13-like [Photinus pyralis]